MKILELILYLPNKPNLKDYRSRRGLNNLKKGEIQEIILKTGNHWRKIFSIFSKISSQLTIIEHDSWQAYRDDILLTKISNDKVSFSTKLRLDHKDVIHIITGKAHWGAFDIEVENFKEVDNEGRILNHQNIYLTPYFDYRQFPNELVETLIKHIKASTN